MTRLILIAFAFLAFAFYELSGGDEFVPRKADLIEAARLAEAEEARKAQDRQRVEAEAEKSPPRKADAAIKALEPVTLKPKLPQVENSPPSQSDPARIAAREDEPAPPITLVSLEQSATLFAQPTQRLQEVQPQLQEVQPDEALPSDIREVAGSRVNLRDGPGTNFGVLTSLVRGTEVEVLDRDGGWVKLRALDEDFTGWMAESLLTGPSG